MLAISVEATTGIQSADQLELRELQQRDLELRPLLTACRKGCSLKRKTKQDGQLSRIQSLRRPLLCGQEAEQSQEHCDPKVLPRQADAGGTCRQPRWSLWGCMTPCPDCTGRKECTVTFTSTVAAA